MSGCSCTASSSGCAPDSDHREADIVEVLRVAVVGGGIFGAVSALRLAELQHRVTLFERLPELMQGTSRVGNRLHLGFHYPRHSETAHQCMRGYERFKKEFSPAIIPGVTNAYFIATEGSLTSADAFLAFCDRLCLPHTPIDPARFVAPIDNVDLGIVTPEVLYDPAILRPLIAARLLRSRVALRLRTEVVAIARREHNQFAVSTGDGERHEFDAVVNCAYANANRIADHLGHQVEARQYEYVGVPIIELDQMEPISATIMDGPFVSLLPFGGRNHLLIHVTQSVLAREDVPLLNPAWLDPETSPLASLDKQAVFESVRSSSATFIPSLRKARLKGFTEGPRMVLAGAEDTDARPSLAALREPGYVEVFSGKVVHCTWVADEVANLLGAAEDSNA